MESPLQEHRGEPARRHYDVRAFVVGVDQRTCRRTERAARMEMILTYASKEYISHNNPLRLLGPRWFKSIGFN